MVRAFLLLLAVLEIAAGVFGLVITTSLFSLHTAGQLLNLWPMLATVILLLAAGAAIFVRRPWSYYLHIICILLVGALYALFVGPRFGLAPQWLWLQAAFVAAPLTVIFLLAPVRRFFGV
jgi:hypothetical protein